MDHTKGIRDHYADEGVEAFYSRQGKTYRNPHEKQVIDLLKRNAGGLHLSRAFDLCCGSGEVSLALAQLGYSVAGASDPFTGEAYSQRCGKACLPLSFDDIISDGLPEEYSSIICSFAFHLCPSDKRFSLAWRLFQHSPRLVVISPHKQPELEKLEGIVLEFEDFSLTERGKKVFLKAYRSTFRS